MGKAITLVVTGSIGVVAVVSIGERRFENDIEGHVAELHADAGSGLDRAFTDADLNGLTAPVRRYFEHVVEEDQPYVRSVRLHQRGEFRRLIETDDEVVVEWVTDVFETHRDEAPLFTPENLASFRGEVAV